ncbi:A disintegrin and metalloproteinase with thrombospondin motifs adt-2-like [Leptopilina heterotoma]|uniref:A disintegrin and metalloproteinase with thrombospondin motifs adt-2-like n=1 Tax=Leptopilina heterotoma TaxID=63436 RepID=UPI001CA7C1EE|nr:A disintegrin and metalloproteinase with thrombospondin motifs adt-2-like [Leptopilina heterotoma]
MSTIVLTIFQFLVISAVTSFDNQEDFEIVFLPISNAKREIEILNFGKKQVPLSFQVFDQKLDLLLRRNDKLLSPNFQVWRQTNSDFREQVPELNSPVSCHYLYRDDNKSASISFCEDRKMQGIIFMDNMALEIIPMENNFFHQNDVSKRSEISHEPHIFKRSSPPNITINKFTNEIPIKRETVTNEKKISLTMELAVFFDEMAYKIFTPFFNRNEEKLRDMLLAYVNGIQAIYHHPSLGVEMNIVLVRLEIMRQQPRELPHFHGERGNLLDSFCRYSKIHNSADDNSKANHWDIGLYVSGLDFYALENGKKNSVTMGLATVGGICLKDYSCVIAELGVTNTFGKPYPSAGFTSVYIAAHEIGHNLGMHHDSIGNSCPKNGYIMSPSRGTVDGETNWSECSREIARNLFKTKNCLLDSNTWQIVNPTLNHEKYQDFPGRRWTAKRQCELFLRDDDAEVVTLTNACQSLQCASPHKTGYYLAGPALQGTKCSSGERSGECQGGECLPVFHSSNGTIGVWSEWRTEKCQSGCIQKSRGFVNRRRKCDNSDCEGNSLDVQICRDERLCKRKRKSAKDFATMKCRLFSGKLQELDGEAGGLQASHEIERPWMACAIFCRRRDFASYYTPRVELNDLGLDPYFPDGTWCHYEEGQHYFCRQHHCLPENFQFVKSFLLGHNYFNIGPQNVQPPKFPDEMIKYFSLDLNGKPLLTTLGPLVLNSPSDDPIDLDYVQIPESAKKTKNGENYDLYPDLKSMFM